MLEIVHLLQLLGFLKLVGEQQGLGALAEYVDPFVLAENKTLYM
jgi:hypothetical protein